ncbi:fatty-acyl-CoA synthase [Truncatella angustata]|uniref:Fatty-acyl-CoA synthase n=1 Tax=Truncatella angustata TaxID=152316 RepID=A0A9P8UGE0_9PEZI|nr:fatty-acyl-CoA synthase [Truncatella angustata]KAH6651700.1 fatty-acyl-CoA synthase [Truncatella angustata]
MAFATAGVIAGATAVATYIDAKYHVRHDLRSGSNAAKIDSTMKFIAERYAHDKMLIYHIFEDRVGTAEGNYVFLIFEGRQWTYTEFFNAVQPIANWLLKDLGVKRGEMVAIDGGNSPEWLMLWLAIEAIGASSAFINHNLTGRSLRHCVELGKVRYLLADTDVKHLVSPIEAELSSSGVSTIYYSPEFLQSFRDAEILPAERRKNINPMDAACLIYTSGTTGLPKGVVMERARELRMSSPGSSSTISLKPGDRMYTCLPLFHGAGHALCVTPCVGAGATVVLSRKFSHASFWPEVHSTQATHLQYVGELCRYLVNAPPSKLDKGHKVKMAWGNGMRADVWEEFRQRFGIECINELYAGTDSLGFSTNANRGDFSKNAIAVRGKLWHWWNGGREKRILIDPNTEEVLRAKNGLAIEAKSGEVGEMIHQLDAQNPELGHPTYFGNHGASVKRKILNVFRKGDLWFRSGDLMRLDLDGRLYFVDRLGDTYRWKSENVSTNEVSDVIGEFSQIAETNVYGVQVPNTDGRAGCAAIVPRGTSATRSGSEASLTLDLKALAEHSLSRLPRYAVPIFIRTCRELEYTGTMKLQKGRLRSEGIDLDLIEKSATEKGEAIDTLYWLPPNAREYVPFSRKELKELQGGAVKL